MLFLPLNFCVSNFRMRWRALSFGLFVQQQLLTGFNDQWIDACYLDEKSFTKIYFHWLIYFQPLPSKSALDKVWAEKSGIELQTEEQPKVRVLSLKRTIVYGQVLKAYKYCPWTISQTKFKIRIVHEKKNYPANNKFLKL